MGRAFNVGAEFAGYHCAFATLGNRLYFVRMKRLLLSVTIGALAVGSAVADRPEVELKSQKDNADYEYVTVTGSHLKQRISKRNIITTTRHGNVLTIDQKEMQRNGNGPLADQLSHYPGVQISGGH